MIHLKLLIKPEDLVVEDVSGYEGVFFTNASGAEVMEAAEEWLPIPLRKDGELKGEIIGMAKEDWHPYGTMVLVSKIGPQDAESAIFVPRTITTKVRCFVIPGYAQGKLQHIDEVVRALLTAQRKIVLFPFVKERKREHIGVISG